MTSVLFVHGTGVRAKSYNATLDAISQSLSTRRPDLTVSGCFWGKEHGSELHARGASVPAIDQARDIDPRGVPDNVDVALWAWLQDDPLFELRLLTSTDSDAEGGASFHPGRRSASHEPAERYRRFGESDAVKQLFNDVGLGGEFGPSCRTIASSPVLDELELDSSRALDVWPAIVRATVAEALRLSEEAGNIARVVYDPTQRDTFVRTLIAATEGDHRGGFGGWAKQRLGSFFANQTTSYVSRRRETFTGSASLFGGDVLLYQRDGAAIRAFTAQAIRQLEPPVVVIAHSLGGIICVDLFATGEWPDIHLVTVGTAAPLFWELDALWGVRAGSSLPTSFPPWTNIYDQRDFLAYIATPLFGDRVLDVRVNNGQPFPRCHSAYWWNSQWQEAVLRACP